MKAKILNDLYYKITIDQNGDIITVESSNIESHDFVKLNDKHLQALGKPVCTKAMLESQGKVKTITGERRNANAHVQ